MQIRDIMTANVESVSPDTDLVRVAQLMKELDIGSVPVVSGDRLVGIITDRDIVIRAVAAGVNLQTEQVQSYVTGTPTTVTPDTDVRTASELMAREQIRRLPVVEGGRLIGVVSIGDLAVDVGKDKLVGDALEKISEPSQPRSNQAGR